MPVEGRPHGEHGTAAEQALVPDSRGERAEGGWGCWGEGSRRSEGAVRRWEEAETKSRVLTSGNLGGEGALLWDLERHRGCG